MNEDQLIQFFDPRIVPLFDPRIVPLFSGNYTLENVIALMNDYPIDEYNTNGLSLLHRMVLERTCCSACIILQIVRTLVERGNNINIGLLVPEEGEVKTEYTPISFATFIGNADVVTLLVELGADVRENVALFASIRFGNFHLIPILLEAGALVEGYKSNVVPMDFAPIHKSLHTLKTLNEAGNPHFPFTYELLFANEPYCATGTDNNIDGGVECLSYLINWNWKGLEEAKEDVDVLDDRQKEYESFFRVNEKTGFDLETASDEWLDPDPRLRWLRRAIL
jgi:hypothetical protein